MSSENPTLINSCKQISSDEEEKIKENLMRKLFTAMNDENTLTVVVPSDTQKNVEYF